MAAVPFRTLGLKHCLESLSPSNTSETASIAECFRKNGFAPPAGADEVRWQRGDVLVPDLVIETIIRLARPLNAKNVLDPAASAGFLLSAMVESGVARSGRGFSSAGGTNSTGRSLAASIGFTWTEQTSTRLWLEQTTEEFDLVVSLPPWGFPPETRTFRVDGCNVECHDEWRHITLAASCLHLRANGVGFFVLSPTFVLRREAPAVAPQLSALGLHLDALLYFPKKAFDSAIGFHAAIAVIRRGQQESGLFVGEISDVPERVDALIENYVNKRSGADLGLGRLMPTGTFRGWDALVASDREAALAGALGGAWRRVMLRDLLSDITLVRSGGDQDFAEESNVVYLPLIGEGPALTSGADLRMKPHNYAQLHVQTDLIEPTFLARYFRTPLGKLARWQQRSGHIPKLAKSTIPEIEVYVPPLAFQRRLIDTATRLDRVSADLLERSERLWSEPSSVDETETALKRFAKHEEVSFKEWLDRLPFPLASILWAYHTAGTDAKARYEHLVHFFEAVAEFHAVILLSGARGSAEAEVELFERELSAALRGPALRAASFGTWNTILAFVAKRFRTLLNGGEDKRQECAQSLCTNDADVLAMLTSSELVGVLQKANSLRNNWVGHTGIVSTAVAVERERALAELLTQLRKIYGTTWDLVDLILPGPSRFRQGVFHYTAKRVMGRSSPFEERAVEADHQLEDRRLHLVGSGERRVLELLSFIVMGSSPETAQNACYFYNRQQGDELRYVSYHFEHAAEIIERNTALTMLIKALSRGSA